MAIPYGYPYGISPDDGRKFVGLCITCQTVYPYILGMQNYRVGCAACKQVHAVVEMRTPEMTVFGRHIRVMPDGRIQDPVPEYPRPAGTSYAALNAQYPLGPKAVMGGAVRLWRVWNVVRGASPVITEPMVLKSMSSGWKWKWEAQEAHAYPTLYNEHIGFHGFYHPKEAQNMGVGVYGAFLGWGKSTKHTLGMRTQFAQVDCILDNARYHSGPYSAEYLKAVANQYGVPLVSWEDCLKMPVWEPGFATENIRKSDAEMMRELDQKN